MSNSSPRVFSAKRASIRCCNVTLEGRKLLRGETEPKLIKPATKQSKSRNRFSKKDKQFRVDDSTQADFDTNLFNHLQVGAKQIATESGVPAYIVFGDAALQDMARRVPSTLDEFAAVEGVEPKASDFGVQFLRSDPLVR